MTIHIEDFTTGTPGDILGPSLTWTERRGDTDLVDAAGTVVAETITLLVNTHTFARAEDAVSTADHYVEVVIHTDPGSGIFSLVAARYSASQEWCYAFLIEGGATPTLKLVKYNKGAIEVLETDIESSPLSYPLTARIETTTNYPTLIVCKIEGVTKLSTTDNQPELQVQSRGGIGGLDGVGVQFESYTISDMTPDDGVLIQYPEPYSVIQRTNNLANINIAGNYTGGPTAIEASWNDGDYQVIDASPSGGRFAGTLLAQPEGQGILTVRWTNDISKSDTSDNVGVGDVFLVAGQSNAVGYGINNQSYSHATLKASKYVGIPNSKGRDAWKELIDPTSTDGSSSGSIWPLLATYIMASQNVPVAFITTAFSGAGLVDPAQWSGGSETAAIQQTVDAHVQGVRAVLWWQGERDAYESVSKADYQDALETLIDTFSTNIGANPPTVIFGLGEVNGENTLDDIREAQIATWSRATALYGPLLYDVDLNVEGDSTHFKSDLSLQLVADRLFAALNDQLYSGLSGRGPQVTKAIYNKNTVTLTFDEILEDAVFSLTTFKVEDDIGVASVLSVEKISSRVLMITLDLTSLSGSVTISLGIGGNDLAGEVIPTRLYTLPDTTTISLPAEFFWNTPVIQNTIGAKADSSEPQHENASIVFVSQQGNTQVFNGRDIESDKGMEVINDRWSSRSMGGNFYQ